MDEILANPRQTSRSRAEAYPVFGASSERIAKKRHPSGAAFQKERPDFSGLIAGRANGIRTRVAAVKGRCPDP